MIHKHPLNRHLWLLPVLLALAFNFNVLSNGFGWDDEKTIQNIKSVEHWWNIFLPALDKPFFSKSGVYYYRPLISSSYLLDFKIWGPNPFGFHLSVLIFHVINTGLVFLLARRLLVVDGSRLLVHGEKKKKLGNWKLRNYFPFSIFSFPDSPPAPTTSHVSPLTSHHLIPLIAASLFAVHPIHAESVAWIAGRSDVLCTTLVLASFILYMQHQKTRNSWTFSFSMLAFFLALLAKETAVGLIPVFFAYEFFLKNISPGDHQDLLPTRSHSYSGRHLLLRLTAPVFLLGVYLWLRTTKTILSLGNTSPGEFELLPLFGNAMASTGLYFKMMLWPSPHSPYIGTLPEASLFLIFSFALLVWIGIALGITLVRRHKLAGISLVWTLGMLAPAIVVGILKITPTAAAERYVYAPSVGVVILAAWLMIRGYQQLPESLKRHEAWVRPIAVFCLITVILLAGVTSWNRNRVWRSSLDFWKYAAAASPEAGQPRVWLGTYHAREGRVAEAEFEYRQAILFDEKKLGPDHPLVGIDLHTLAVLYKNTGQYDKAVPLLMRSLRILEKAWGPQHPSVAVNLNDLADVYHLQERYSEAEPFYRRALAIREKVLGREDPSVAVILNNLGVVYRVQGRYREAEALYRRSLELREKAFGPEHRTVGINLLNLGVLFAAERKHDEAEAAYRQALSILERSLGPNHPDVKQTVKNYAALLRDIHRGEEADRLEDRYGRMMK